MRLLLLGAGAGLLIAAFSMVPALMRPNNVYAAPIDQVHQTLADMRIPVSADGPLGNHPVTRTENAPTAISWVGGPRGAIGCTARLTPVDGATTRVDTRCTTDAPDSGAMLALARIGMIEQIDSTLRGRPYNRQAVTIGASTVTAIAKVAPDRPHRDPTVQAPAFAPAVGSPREAPTAVPATDGTQQPAPVSPSEPVIDSSPVN